MHDDQRYINGLREGNMVLIETIYRNHASSISKWIIRNNGTIDDAKDIFQETLEALFRISQNPNFTLTCPLGSLIFTLSRNKWFDKIKARGRENKVRKLENERYIDAEQGQFNSVLEEVEEEEIRQKRLSKTFQKLSDTCQKLLRLLSTNKKTEEIVEIMGMKQANTLYRRKKACLERWRNLYQQLVIGKIEEIK